MTLLLKPELQKLKLKNIRESVFQPILQTKKERQFLTLILHEIKDKLIALNILSEKEWLELIAGLRALALQKDNLIVLSALYQISATR